MPHRNRLAAAPQPSPEYIPSRLSERIKSWHVIVGAAVALVSLGAWVTGSAGQYAKHDEVEAQVRPVVVAEKQHDADIAAIKQAVTDTRSDVEDVRRQLTTQNKMLVDILTTVHDVKRSR